MHDFSRVAKSIDFLCRNTCSQPDLRAIAAHAGLSEFHFQRLFQQWAGISPKRFLQFLTLGHARNLLSHSATLVDVSLATGLSGPGRLHDLFINLEGMTPGQFKYRGRGLTLHWAVLPTPFGPALFAALGQRLVGLTFLAETGDEAPQLELLRRWPEAHLLEAPEKLAPFAQLLSDRLWRRPLQPLALTLRGTPFQLKVWQALLEIPEGRALTYQDLARLVGDGATAANVGASIRRNPIAYLIPCHRVIRASGAFGYYHWGSRRKEVMLALEQARLQPE